MIGFMYWLDIAFWILDALGLLALALLLTGYHSQTEGNND